MAEKGIGSTENGKKNDEFPPCHQMEHSLFTSDNTAGEKSKQTECHQEKESHSCVNNMLIYISYNDTGTTWCFFYFTEHNNNSRNMGSKLC